MTNIDTIDTSITVIPEPGHRGIDTNNDFVVKQEAYQDHQRDTLRPELESLRGELNTSIGQMNTVSGEVEVARDTATSSALLAQGLANNKGAWANLTGALSVPAAVNHNGSIWVLNTNLADVTASEPTSANSDWTESSGVTQEELDAALADIATNKTDIATNKTDIKNQRILGKSAKLNGDLTLSNTVLTNGFQTVLGTTAPEVDNSTQWGDTANETYDALIWSKDRNNVESHRLSCGLLGDNYLQSDTTSALIATVPAVTTDDVSWIFQTTHKITGITNHGKTYTCHYNPITGFTMVEYEGSGLAGHEIPHHLGRELGLFWIKNLSLGTTDWAIHSSSLSADDYYLESPTTGGQTKTNTRFGFGHNETHIVTSASSVTNGSGYSYIMYGWANSYYDADNVLLGNYETGTYRGTGVSGNKITTRGRPAYIMVKRLDSAESWVIWDNIRNSAYPTIDKELLPDGSGAEITTTRGSINEDGFTIDSTGTRVNALAGEYLYFVVYDNDIGSGKSKYPKSSTTSEITGTNLVLSYSDGVSNGVNSSIENIGNYTFTTKSLVNDAINYFYKKKDDNTLYGTDVEPMWIEGSRQRAYAGENPLIYDEKTKKWYNSTNGNELITNGTFDVDVSGWSLHPSGDLATMVWNNGTALLDRNGGLALGYYQPVSTIIGKKYKVEFYCSFNDTTANNRLTAYDSSLNILGEVEFMSTGYFSFEFIANETTTDLTFVHGAGGSQSFAVDNVTMFESDIIKDIAESTPLTFLGEKGYVDANGNIVTSETIFIPTLVEEYIKAKIIEGVHKGDNSCTAKASIDATTTPPTVEGGFNISRVEKIATGYTDIYFDELMDFKNYSVTGSTDYGINIDRQFAYSNKELNKVTVLTRSDGGNVDTDMKFSIHIFGGKK